MSKCPKNMTRSRRVGNLHANNGRDTGKKLSKTLSILKIPQVFWSQREKRLFFSSGTVPVRRLSCTMWLRYSAWRRQAAVFKMVPSPCARKVWTRWLLRAVANSRFQAEVNITNNNNNSCSTSSTSGSGCGSGGSSSSSSLSPLFLTRDI